MSTGGKLHALIIIIIIIIHSSIKQPQQQQLLLPTGTQQFSLFVKRDNCCMECKTDLATQAATDDDKNRERCWKH